MYRLKVGLISLGCDKNKIDSEIILNKLKVEYDITLDMREAEIIIVNTCGFIESAKQESIDTILEMSKYKEKFKCRILIVTGCLSQRYGKKLVDLMPEVDIMLGVNDYDKLNSSIENYIEGRERIYKFTGYKNSVNDGDRMPVGACSTAYVRIAEGCDNFCTYCIIPKIRGKYRSRDMESILEECRNLSRLGTREIILIAQDVTRYGIDIYGKKVLHELIRKISKIDGIKWIRLLYCYPEEITENLIDEIARNDKVCNYIDIPLQHISDKILKAMGRKGTKSQIIDNIEKLRSRVPGITIRTTLIVGFPGEDEESFQELKDFVAGMKFEKLGVFKYSREEGTPAYSMKWQVSESLKQEREEDIMLLQQNISRKINRSKVGKTYDVIIDGIKDEFYFGRSCEMSPEIDGCIFVKRESGREIKDGTILKVKITDSLEYDLVGVVCDEFSE